MKKGNIIGQKDNQAASPKSDCKMIIALCRSDFPFQKATRIYLIENLWELGHIPRSQQDNFDSQLKFYSRSD